MLDYAGEMEVIEEVKSGVDVHQAVADKVKISRALAKTANFAILYGAGIKTLARQTGLTYNEAKLLKADVLDALPGVERLVGLVKSVARDRGFISNWLGRRYYFTDPRFVYKAINTLIQGGTADVIKVAMNDIHEVAKLYHMVLTIHDELVFEMPVGIDKSVIDGIVHVMEQTYPCTHLPLTVSVEHSYQSLADKQEGYATGNKVQVEGNGRP
jgi:DNA polymerase-1